MSRVIKASYTEGVTIGFEPGDISLPVPIAMAAASSDVEPFNQGLFDMAGVSLLVPQHIKRASRQIDFDAVQGLGSKRLSDDKIRNRRGAITGLRAAARTASFEGKLQRNSKIGKSDAGFPKRGLEHRPRAGTMLAQHPGGRQQILRRDFGSANPGVFHPDDHDERVAVDLADGK